MKESLKETWQKIQRDPPGKRFRRQFRRRHASRQGIFKRILFMGSGSVLGTLGLIMLFTPGPGIFFVFVGLGLIAQESLMLAIILDKFEVALRKWVDWGLDQWNKSSSFVKALMVLFACFVTALALYGAYLTFLT